MKFKTLGCELRRRLREQEQKNENIRKSCKLDQLFVRQSFQQRQSQIQSHLRFLHQIRLKSMLSTVSSAASSSNRRPWLNLSSLRCRPTTQLKTKVPAKLTRQSVTGPDVADPAYNADVALGCYIVIIHAEHLCNRRGYCFDFGCMYVCMFVC